MKKSYKTRKFSVVFGTKSMKVLKWH